MVSILLSFSGPTDLSVSGTEPPRNGVFGGESDFPLLLAWFRGVAEFPLGGNSAVVDGMPKAECSSCVDADVDPCSDTLSVISSTIPAMARRRLMYFCRAGRRLTVHAAKSLLETHQEIRANSVLTKCMFIELPHKRKLPMEC